MELHFHLARKPPGYLQLLFIPDFIFADSPTLRNDLCTRMNTHGSGWLSLDMCKCKVEKPRSLLVGIFPAEPEQGNAVMSCLMNEQVLLFSVMFFHIFNAFCCYYSCLKMAFMQSTELALYF